MRSTTTSTEMATVLLTLRQHLDSANFVAAEELLNTMDERDFAEGSPLQYGSYLSLKARALFYLARYEEALTVTRYGFDLIKTSDENLLIAEIQTTMAKALTEIGEIQQAERVYRDLISTYRRLDDAHNVIRSLNRLARLFFLKGQFEKAVEYLLEAEEYARKLESPKLQAMIIGNLGTILNLTGEFVKAVPYLEHSVQLNQKIGDHLNLSCAYLSLAYSQMHLKQLDRAESSLKCAADLIDAGNYRAERVTLDQYRSRFFILREDCQMGLTCARRSLELAQTLTPGGSSVCQSEQLVAEALFGKKEYSQAQKVAKSALRLAERIGAEMEIGLLHRLLAQIASATGKPAEAEREFANSARHLSSCCADFELAMTYVAWSEATQDIASRERHRQEAERLLVQLKLDSLYLKSLGSTRQSESSAVSLVGESPTFVAVLREANACSSSDVPILLLGETGSGKDQLAKYIHQQSARRERPLVALNCAAIPVELAESELFGYEKGAFTSAGEQKSGLIEAAHGGTLFLNEIGELPLLVQAKLLAVLGEKRFFRLGGKEPRKVDFRLLAATNVDLESAVRQGKFRADLYYRLAVVTLRMPNLTSRRDDSFLLFKNFMTSDKISLDSVDSSVLERLQASMRSYPWPGNIRELRNYVELFSLTEHRNAGEICRRLIQKLDGFVPRSNASEASPSLHEEMEQFEKSKIFSALQMCGGIIRRAASNLGLPEGTLRSKMKKYGISAA